MSDHIFITNVIPLIVFLIPKTICCYVYESLYGAVIHLGQRVQVKLSYAVFALSW